MPTTQILVDGYQLPDLETMRVDIRFHARTEDEAREALTVVAGVPGVSTPVVASSGPVVWADARAGDVKFAVFFPRVESAPSPGVAAAEALLAELGSDL